eukprot:scaffold587412_cov46-Prasinocladus_malaysianus.AAC.1
MSKCKSVECNEAGDVWSQTAKLVALTFAVFFASAVAHPALYSDSSLRAQRTQLQAPPIRGFSPLLNPTRTRADEGPFWNF